MLFPVVFITSSYLFLLFRFARFGQVSFNCGLLH